jgi:hypothetical protein
LRNEKPAGAFAGTLGIFGPERMILCEQTNSFGQAVGIIVLEIESCIVPEFVEC